LLGNIKQHLI